MTHLILPPIFMFNLITSNGKIISFQIKACADLYQKAYGGVVFTQQVLDTTANAVIIEPISKETA
jgi:hypothetical protein